MRYETSSKVPIGLLKSALRLPFIFLVVLLLILALQGTTKVVTGQPSSPTSAFDKLVQAFQVVQQAESHGVSRADIIQLSAELNTAFAYYEDSARLLAENNSTGSAAYATLSINLSSDVSSRAGTLENNAQNQLLISRGISYGTAFVIALVSAFVVVEFHQIRAFLHRRRIFKTPLGEGQ